MVGVPHTWNVGCLNLTEEPPPITNGRKFCDFCSSVQLIGAWINLVDSQTSEFTPAAPPEGFCSAEVADVIKFQWNSGSFGVAFLLPGSSRCFTAGLCLMQWPRWESFPWKSLFWTIHVLKHAKETQLQRFWLLTNSDYWGLSLNLKGKMPGEKETWADWKMAELWK